jgi:pSer/pThr/pTyr-binding forkhead associated (FHA) protein
LLVTDLNSTNGTYIDGVRVNHATILPVGSVLKLGQISLRHSIRPDAEDGRGNSGMQPGRLAAAS